MKRAFSGNLLKSLDNISEFIKKQVPILTDEQVKTSVIISIFSLALIGLILIE